MPFTSPPARLARDRHPVLSGVAALLTAALMIACANAGGLGPEPASADAAVDRAVPDIVSLGVGESTSAASLLVTFVGVSDDSRCPTGTNCVWEGDAVVELRARAGQQPPETVSLHANPRFTQEAVVGGVRLRLVRLEPYPDAAAPIAADAYRVVLSVDAEQPRTE